MTEWVDIRKDESHVARERARARALRGTNWWRARIANGVCHYCGATFPPGELTMDHVVPLSRGGFSRRGNVVPCCLRCNREKKYLTPAERLLDELETKRSG